MTIDERIEALTMNLELAHRDIQDLKTAAAERDREYQDRWDAAAERATAAEERHERELADIRATIRQAVLLSVREARAEREKRRELGRRVDDLTAAVQRMLDSRHGNGHPPTEP